MLNAYLTFDTAQETTDGRGWQLTYWDDAIEAQVLAPTTEYFYRIAATALSYTITNKVLTSNVATLTLNATHSFVVGDYVTVDCNDDVFDGTYVITAKAATTISYAKTNANITSAAATGTVVTTTTALARMQALFSDDPTIIAYFTDKAETTVLTANAATVTSTRDANLTAEGLTP